MHFLGIFPLMESQILIFLKCRCFSKKKTRSFGINLVPPTGLPSRCVVEGLRQEALFLEKTTVTLTVLPVTLTDNTGGNTHPQVIQQKRTLRNHGIIVFFHFKPDEIRWALLAGVSAQWVIGNHTVDGCWEVIDPVNSVMKYSLYTPWN